MTRRKFSSLTTALPVLGASEKPIRVAMIGTAHGHALSKVKALRSMAEYDFAGVHRPDTSEPAVQDVREVTLAEILNDTSIELLAIESGDFAHNLTLAQQCVSANKFVHLDKPPGADLAAFRSLLAEAASRKRIVQMGYQWRYQPAMHAAIDAARKGWLGSIYRFRASIDKLVPPHERHEIAKFPGGMMFSEGCHLVDRAVDLLGKPTKITGIIRCDSSNADRLADNNLVILQYERAIAEISLAGFSAHGNRYRYLEILGSNGQARVQPYSPFRLSVDLDRPAGPYKSGEQTMELPSPPGLTYTPDFREMAAVIRHGAKPSYTAEHDLITHETLLRACGMIAA